MFGPQELDELCRFGFHDPAAGGATRSTMESTTLVSVGGDGTVVVSELQQGTAAAGMASPRSRASRTLQQSTNKVRKGGGWGWGV